jgi:hypothetical protein
MLVAFRLALLFKFYYMLNQYEVPALIADEFPEIREPLAKLSNTNNIGKVIQLFARFTEENVQFHNLRVVEKCMRLADRIYVKGNETVKNAIENIFIFSFSTMRHLCDRIEWRIIQSRIPVTLYSTYIRQVNHTDD